LQKILQILPGFEISKRIAGFLESSLDLQAESIQLRTNLSPGIAEDFAAEIGCPSRGDTPCSGEERIVKFDLVPEAGSHLHILHQQIGAESHQAFER
jgi:hypothetical protein